MNITARKPWRNRRQLVLEGEVRAVHINHVLPAAITLFFEDLQKLSLIRYTRHALGLGNGRIAVVTLIVREVSPSLYCVGGNFEPDRVGVEKASPECPHGITAFLGRKVRREHR